MLIPILPHSARQSRDNTPQIIPYLPLIHSISSSTNAMGRGQK